MTIPFIPDECYITYDIHTMALRELENINMINFGFLSFVKVSHVTVWKSQLHHCNVHKNNFFTDLNTLVQVVTQLGEIVKEWRKRAEYSQAKKMNRNKKMKIDYDKEKSVFKNKTRKNFSLGSSHFYEEQDCYRFLFSVNVSGH